MVLFKLLSRWANRLHIYFQHDCITVVGPKKIITTPNKFTDGKNLIASSVEYFNWLESAVKKINGKNPMRPIVYLICDCDLSQFEKRGLVLMHMDRFPQIWINSVTQTEFNSLLSDARKTIDPINQEMA